ncbi:glycosyltransferase family 2 protein [Roseibium sp.]|uniref:glycosyltransferase family 2 protein n=1 Tax=Roseibium sp. TaxID=1936156 RepID=UPI003BACE44C
MKISIIIPTRERATYLGAAIQSALAIEDDHIELIVSNNASSDQTEDVVKAFDDPRLNYIRTEKRISMRQNFQFALDRASGDYILFIGDDDAVLPGQFPALRTILETHKPDSLSWPRLAYRWPEDTSARKFGRVRMTDGNTFGAVRKVPAREPKEALLSASVTWDDSFPALYHGIVSRACVDRLTLPQSEFFQSHVPDIYFSYLGIVEEIDHVHADHPFTLSGSSPASTGSSTRNQKNDFSKGSPAAMFVSEAARDPFQDPVVIGSGIPAGVFQVLEAVLAAFPEEADKVDNVAWYKFVLKGSASHPEASRKVIAANLAEHARRKGLSAELERIVSDVSREAGQAAEEPAETAENAGKGWFEKRINSWKEKRKTLKFFGAETALNAANMVDAVLTKDYQSVLAGNKPRSRAWKDAKKRSRALRAGR